MQLAAAVALMPLLFFWAAHTTAVTQDALQWAGQPQKLTLPFGGSGPI